MAPAQSIEPWSNPLTSLCGPLNLFTLGFGGDGRAGLREMEKLLWMVETTDVPVRVLAVIDGHSSADGGRYGLWVWLSVVKKDKRFLKGEGYGL
ncbi:hypothetical protein POTOM_042072 [Populus tomentosa]|uniref:Uncharacterized protein n=1 Tax=Populus tomentosa TaxID=118781 RepID=A0A8X7YMZ6_POPTO|nr:hypothetical protein POTOM_042072 [Populus tomentosa]